MSALLLYGDFNCPWSYLAFRRSRVLAAAGVPVDWRAVEHAPWVPGAGPSAERPTVTGLQGELDRVLATLLPEEGLPYDLTGFVPRTRASVAAYAEAYGASVGPLVAQVLFESFWMHGIDIGDARVLRTVLGDAIRSGSSGSEILHEWGYCVDVTGGPVTSAGWRRLTTWALRWRESGTTTVPLLFADGTSPAGEPIVGVEAVAWLGEEILRRGLDPATATVPLRHPRFDPRELPSLGWTTEFGGRWLSRHRDAELAQAG